ncbi:fungal-specific transcription factor domain-containing protein [Ilyonectria destructans]|nr:fungal-specific transcription factor domain-containing protein [Ilyonectria destructans]
MNIEHSLLSLDSTESSIGARRSRKGCQQCRKRKRKCDERHPRCLACEERDLPCNWQREPRRPQIARRINHFNKDFTLPHEMRPLVTVFAVPSAPIQDGLLSYFNAKSPLWLTSGGDAASCSGVIVPIALHNPLVLNCVLVLAAGDLCKYQPASSDMASLTCGFYGQAIAGINLALSQLSSLGPEETYSQNDDDILLAIILLCVHEVVNFTSTSRIFPHLNAAAVLCHSRCFSSAASNGHLRAFLFEIFCYIFTLTAFSHGRILPLSLATEIFISPFLSGSHYKAVLLGQQCRDIFSIILKISILQSSISSPPNLDETTIFELRILMAQLEDDPGLQVGENEATSVDEKAVAELYRLACLIYVKKILDPTLSDQSPVVQGLVAHFISNLNTLPPTSPANNILCWPLFMAGMSSIILSHQRLIIGRLRRNYESSWRSDILSRTADLLSARWREDRAPECDGTRFRDTDERQWPGVATDAFDFPLVLL